MSSSPSPLEARLERLERALAAINGEVASIRAELGRAAPADAPAASNVPADPAPVAFKASASGASRPRRPSGASSRELDFERLVGRYGMLGIAVLAAVAAVGTFLSWAIRSGYLDLGPGARVIIGLVSAAALGSWGITLRRTERSFGSSVLGLALVIVQGCAYAAGPYFHLVPTTVAFIGTALVSWALAIFAHGENDEPLWCVGFGGAAIAPFVTSDGGGNLYGLLIYGLIVLLPACFAISHRDWPVAWRVFHAITALFALAGAALAHRFGIPGFAAAFAFPFVIAAAGVVPFAPDARKRPALRWMAGLAVVSAIAAPVALGQSVWTVSGLIGAGALVWLFLLDRHAALPRAMMTANQRSDPALDWVDAFLLPLLLFAEASNVFRLHGALMPVWLVATLGLLVFTWRRDVGALRSGAAFASLVAASSVIAVIPLEEPLGRLAGYVALGLLAFAAHRARPSVSWIAGGCVLIVGSGLASVGVLTDRAAYAYTPFATEPSATALVVLVALAIIARFWRTLRVATRTAMGDRPEWTYASQAQRFIRGVALAPWIWAFLWGLIELAHAYSPSTATLLLVTYFAVTAVGCVGVGRARHSARLRQAGLALAIAAAGTAVVGATSYFDFGARIAAYLVTSGFLLGIAYWYRKPGDAEAIAV